MRELKKFSFGNVSDTISDSQLKRVIGGAGYDEQCMSYTVIEQMPDGSWHFIGRFNCMELEGPFDSCTIACQAVYYPGLVTCVCDD